MELRAAALALLLVCAIIFPATQGYMPHCCVKTSKYVPRYILRSRGRYQIQTDKGACDIPAVM
uniref:Chemokine interleukin-8-like domain-containing protein n=1 Tax=Electrophorus electricus TaxID=8005 RepID=A0A4W4F6K6_ELEEL